MLKSEGRLQYLVIKTFIHILALVPRKQMDRIAVPLGSLLYRLDKHHRTIALDNISKAYRNEVPPSDIPKMVKASFIQLVTVALEIPSLLKLSKDNLDSYVCFSGSHHLETALSKGKGVLFLTAHLGNWELMALAASLKYDVSCNLLVRPLDFSPIDRVLTEIRCRTGNTVLDKIRSARMIRNMLSENQLLAVLLDQNASWYDGVYVPFFGRTACTNKGFGLFALRYNPTVLPIFNIRQADGRYHIMFDAPVTLKRTGNIQRDLVENTALFNRVIEKHIRMAPDNWLWVHRRWRLKEIPERVKQKMARVPLTGL